MTTVTLLPPTLLMQLNDSAAIMFYLAKKYPGPATPQGIHMEAKALDMWSVQQDYYSFVLSPMHDIILKGKDHRNLRLVDQRTEGDDKTIKDLVELHRKRCDFLEKRLATVNGDYLCGEYTYADILLYTNVRTAQMCKGFQGFRDVCGGDPFKDYPKICAIVDKVAAHPAIFKTAKKFTDTDGF